MLLLNFVTLILNLALQGLQVQAKITALEASKQTQMVIYESQAKIGMKESVMGSFICDLCWHESISVLKERKALM